MAFPSDLDPTLDVGDATELDTEFFAEIDRRILVLEAKVGSDNSPVTTSLDYRVAHGGSSPTTTAGDMIVRGASADQRLAIGADGYVLTVSSGAPAWTSAPWVTATGTILTGRVLAWDGSAWVATALSASYVGAVPVARTLAGLDLTADRSASALKTALAITAADVSGVVPTTRTLAGLDLSTDRTASAIKTALSIAATDVSGVVPSTRTVAGLDLSTDRSAASLRTALSTDTTADPRTPSAHASSHATGGSDAITPGDIGAASFATGLDAARPAASAGLVGQVYYATNSGIDYRCISSSTWRVVGARGAVEGFDTTAVALSGVNATGNTNINAGVVASIVCTFAMPSSPSGVQIIASGGEWQLEIGNNGADRYQISLYRAGFGTMRVTLGTVSGSPTTLHTIALAFSGTTTSYSLDGGAVQTASHVSGSASGNNPLHFSSGGFPTVAQVTTLGLWSTALSNADLVVASAAYATGRIPTVTGTLHSQWHAGWFTAGVLTQQLQVGALGGTLTWTGFPLVLK